VNVKVKCVPNFNQKCSKNHIVIGLSSITKRVCSYRVNYEWHHKPKIIHISNWLHTSANF